MTEKEACQQAYNDISHNIHYGVELLKDALLKLKEAENCWDFVKLKIQLIET